MFTTLYDFFLSQFDADTPFVAAFLDGHNLLRIQHMLTEQLRARTKNPEVPLVQFSDAIVSALMTFAFKYRLAENVNMAKVNHVFVDQVADQNEARYFETAFWKRWCSQGLPDPNNIPLPLAHEFTDFTVETDGYILNNPVGYRKFPHW